MKIAITTNQGEVVEILTEKDIGNLDKPLARQDAMDQIARAVKIARELDAQ